MKKFLLLIGLLFSVLTRNQAQIPANIIAELQDTLTDVGNLYKFRGLNVAVRTNDGVWSSSYGNSGPGIPLDTNMLIGIGSNTKTFVSVCVLKLVQSGQLSLDDTLGMLAPGYPNVNPSITLRQILNHTSGMASYTNNNAFWITANSNLSYLWTKDEILQNYITAPSFAPGASWEYCNTGYTLAGKILELKLGKPIHQIIRDSILTPLGMTKTFFPPEETPNLPYAYFWSDVDGDNVLDLACDWNNNSASIIPVEFNTAANSAGALVSTAADITKFWKALFDGQLLSSTTLNNDMLQFVSIGGNQGYGLGIFKMSYFNNPIFSHGGTWVGQIHSNLADSNRGIYISVLSNQDSLKNSFTENVVRALYRILLTTWPTSTASTTLASGVDIYPNPAKNLIYFRSPDSVNKFELFSATGQPIRINHSENSIDISGLQPGIYYLKLYAERGVLVKSFVKE